MRTAPGFVVAAAALLVMSCSKPEPPKITPQAARVASVSPAGLTLSVDLKVDNPNSFPLVMRTVSGKLLVGSGVEVGTARVDSAATVPAKGSSTVTSALEVKWSNFAALVPLATTGKPIGYTFEGLANVGGESLNFDVPFRLQGELTAAQIVQAGVRGLGLPGLPVAPAP